MAWDEENRLMALSDNDKTSRYTYNATGERVVKSHGYLEGMYVNGAPQGLTFHETEDYTIYPAPILSVSPSIISSATGAWPPKSVQAYSKTPTAMARTSSRPGRKTTRCV